MILEIFLGLLLAEGILVVFFQIVNILKEKAEVIDAEYVVLDKTVPLFADESDFSE